MASKRPQPSEYPERYGRYLDLVPEEDIQRALGSQLDHTLEYFRNIPESQAERRYAPGKWTVREVLGHILDTERIYGFRLMTFARDDRTAQTVSDQDLYIQTGDFGAHPLSEWLEEFRHLRLSNLAMVRHLPPDAWQRSGVVSDYTISVRALAYAMVGHERHHINILRERYFGP